MQALLHEPQRNRRQEPEDDDEWLVRPQARRGGGGGVYPGMLQIPTAVDLLLSHP